MRDTLFSPSFGNRPNILIGRDAETSAFSEGLRSAPGSKERSVLVLGQRGSGKTALLWELADLAKEQGFIIAAPTVATDGLLERVVEKLQDNGERYLKGRKRSVSGVSLGALGFSAGLQFSREIEETKSWQYKLSHLVEALNALGKGVAIFVDEVQGGASEMRKLVASYQEIVGERRDIAIVAAGLPSTVSGLLNEKPLTFFNRSRKLVLKPLSTSEVQTAYEQAFDGLGISMPADLLEEAVDAVQGSPYMFQLVGHNIVLAAQEGLAVSAEALGNAIEHAREDFADDVCRTTLAALSDKDEAFLVAMTPDADDSRMLDIAERMGVSADYAQKYRRRLIDAGVIEPTRRGHVRFAVPYLQSYLNARA